MKGNVMKKTKASDDIQTVPLYQCLNCKKLWDEGELPALSSKDEG